MTPFQMMMNLGKQTSMMPQNPMQMMMNLGKNSSVSQFSPQKQATPPIDPQQLKNSLANFTRDSYIQLVQQARQQGISEEDIEKGLNFLLQLK